MPKACGAGGGGVRGGGGPEVGEVLGGRGPRRDLRSGHSGVQALVSPLVPLLPVLVRTVRSGAPGHCGAGSVSRWGALLRSPRHLASRRVLGSPGDRIGDRMVAASNFRAHRNLVSLPRGWRLPWGSTDSPQAGLGVLCWTLSPLRARSALGLSLPQLQRARCLISND